ncbi:ATPase involved in DNA repair [Bernardetia litoralis DSM 6794]|uniref:ATPase involved in DNA repair n=1 Tax=Bernardetia litoralis (strain ATCC 23117 / DSM 6794 / NBRC 15988 / NCIMB 1366 / Fx l1 / Sio-4) TaxID=880071 RepID=I4ALL3_BERLS|nr:AAA family ATPase [Bernardetia litoralis]AFM04848.1 ATPase involved in DNA repair [Bernardetia litoralis DSM 6794]
MFPLSLSINGLYSYKKKHVIKFDTLSEAGVFGVFGKVGSGKSSILEAITFAIFGKTDKLNISGDNRYYNMMNLDSDIVEISFEFLAGKEKEHFLCEFIAKRNSKKFDTVTNYNRKAAKKVNGDWQTIEFNEVEKAIGLSYDNFKRTVIIPQGQFAEFLQLTATPRIDMIKDIFSLHEYDLSKNTKTLLDEIKKQIEIDESIILHRFEYLTEDFIQNKKIEIESLNQIISEQETQINQKNEQKSQLEIIKTIFEEKNKKQIELQKLQAKEENIKNKETNLNQFILIKNQFEQDLKDQKRITINLNSIKEKHKNTEQNYSKVQKNYEKIVELQKEIFIQKEENTKKLEQIEPINHLIKLKEAQVKINEKNVSIEKGTKMTLEKKEEFQIIKSAINKEKNTIAEFKSEIIDTEILQNAFIWFDKNESLAKNNSEINIEVENTKSELEKIEIEKATFETNKLQLSEKEITQSIERKNQEIEKLTMQKGLHQAVHSLENGEPCPVCGSESHPDILDVENIDSNLRSLKKQKKDDEQNLKTLQKREIELARFLEKIDEKKQTLDKQIQKQLLIKTEFEIHQKLFLEKEWKNLSKTEILNIQDEQKIIQTQIKKSEMSLFELEQKLEKITIEIEKYKQRLEFLKHEYALQTGQIKELERNSEKITQIYINSSIQELENTIVEIKKSAELSEQKFLKNQEQEKQFFHQKSELEGTLKSILSQLSTLNQELESNQKQVLQKIEKLNQDSELKPLSQNEIENILNQKINTDNERKEITAFFTNLKTTLEDYQKLEQQTAGKSYENDSFEKLVKEIKELTNKQKQDNSQQIIISQEIKKAEKDTLEKADLTQKLSKLLQRQDNLQTLAKLFKGNSFVDFASTEYLRNLCQLANIRFRELTHHSLELILNEKNEFEVRDFLSEGKTRAIKTLSGGQLFQASLCVALALSESMRKQQEFFFIDEGFGSLDNDSLQIVLTTLQSLQKENKVVGIISHVESLQQEIRTHLHIQKNQTDGSFIKLVAG